MAKRGVVTDYAGNELYAGDLISYSSRNGNRVRQADAVVEEVTAKRTTVEGVGAILVPVLKVRPTGIESGFTKRRTVAAQWITTEHARLIIPNYTGEREA
ncbi:hypothetical protein [Streptomyces chattanoogensis]|uniref:hypothetical protein n=1 Tax=Streptomyces chattanoogensis TaxID=66876 RepID=UPI0036A55AB1